MVIWIMKFNIKTYWIQLVQMFSYLFFSSQQFILLPQKAPSKWKTISVDMWLALFLPNSQWNFINIVLGNVTMNFKLFYGISLGFSNLFRKITDWSSAVTLNESFCIHSIMYKNRIIKSIISVEKMCSRKQHPKRSYKCSAKRYKMK